METEHEIHVGDARDTSLPDDSIDLVVTSPPYPMIEMWDDLFADANPEIETALSAGDGDTAFELMHDELDAVWAELVRVLKPGGIAVINVGDATRKVDGTFQSFPNHAHVLRDLRERGLKSLPDILWRKPSNRLTKFMGSGMLPPNAYAALEHEYLLVFRNGDTREFEPGVDHRYESSYFWEERNEWFSDLWTDVRGEEQLLDHGDLRERSAAFPFELPYRLISMFSVYGDTVLDPFWGTGTTSLAAMVAGRNSVGYELEPDFVELFAERAETTPELSRSVISRRLDDHRAFVGDHGGDLKYDATYYDFAVKTAQERDIRLYAVSDVERDETGFFVTHEPYSE
ncbi:modification methylase [Haladaptatus paucihalophilus DX253]|uniref:Type II methyltransferase n=1 Tax=Haladaptatus paucihalophilus DX253 TaxID=797209 RepID=E7QTH1_HALPU|nr:site-specific DNA-methyltransferase [Haladaptatus paucihalophilus]EFW91900.1 modification methylase [Haladaptatus paucihalophilus DX253]SHK82542.1 DNA modification methylase [Haladaptatus paucihalophilus DX253]